MLINGDEFHLNLDPNGTNSTGRSASVLGYRKFSAFAANLEYMHIGNGPDGTSF